jgi:mannose-1-phosphate guanylyltransferase
MGGVDMSTWTLVLAGGDGSRLRSLTTTPEGVSVPKQFCSLRGGPSLMQEALSRAEAVAPRERICTIVAEEHRRWWEKPLWALSRHNIIVQPANRGTAIGLMLAVLHIAARDSRAQIVVLPSDHYVRDEAALARTLHQAVANLHDDAGDVRLLGIAPENADSELGYIVPGPPVGNGEYRIARFVEKPPLALARSLLNRHALWNALILVGTAGAFLELFALRCGRVLEQMRHAVPGPLYLRSAGALTELYSRLPGLDFSRDVLQGAEGCLRVLPVQACGWSDLGTQMRVAETLRRLAREERAAQAARVAAAQLSLAAQLEHERRAHPALVRLLPRVNA